MPTADEFKPTHTVLLAHGKSISVQAVSRGAKKLLVDEGGNVLGELAAASSAPSIDRALRKNVDAAGKNYDLDAEAIARVLVRHYGDEAETVLARAAEWLPAARRMKR